MRIGFLTLGCKVNFYETEKMIKEFENHGFSVVDFADDADIYVINTCTVTNIADRKSRQMIHRAKKKNPDAIVIAVGCYVDSAGEKIKDEAIDLALSNKDKSAVVSRVEELLRGRDIANAPSDIASRTHEYKQRTRAFLKVQDGCNQFCTYCLIPYVRGRGVLTSTPPEEVEREVREKVDAGYREVVINGIHLSSYGVTEKSADGFVHVKGKPLADLIKRINAIEGLERIRLGSLEPRIITKEWLDEISGCEKLMPHFHLSLQSGCDATLSRMNRHYTTEEYMQSVRLLREVFEDPAITTDVIVGFPGETDEEFAVTKKYIEDVGFSDLHIFQYSMRDGTVAAGMKDQVDPRIKKERSDELLELTEKLKSAYIARRESDRQRILFEEEIVIDGEKYLVGYTERYVRYGVSAEFAAKNGLSSGMIADVEQIFLKNIVA